MARHGRTALNVPSRGRHKGTGMRRGRRGINPRLHRINNRGGGR